MRRRVIKKARRNLLLITKKAGMRLQDRGEGENVHVYKEKGEEEEMGQVRGEKVDKESEENQVCPVYCKVDPDESAI